MTLIAPYPNNENCLRNKTNVEPELETHGQLALPEYSIGDGVLQNIGYGNGTETVPYLGNVCIENSTDVHIGDKNIYHGTVTINQIVYANVPAPISREGDESPSITDGYCTDGVGERRNFDRPPSPDTTPRHPQHGVGKVFFWLRDVSKRRPRETALCVLLLLLFMASLITIPLVIRSPDKRFHINEFASIQPIDYSPDITVSSQRNNIKLRITSRDAWVAQPAVRPIPDLILPVPYVVIHHTSTKNCSSQAQCAFIVRYLQTFNIESQDLTDIAYNFLVGGDGAIYEGRGWTLQGNHSVEYDKKSIGIAFIGTFDRWKPSEIQILICQRLIEIGSNQGYIHKDYKLVIDKILAEKSRPALLEEIKTWKHWAGNV